MKKFELLDKGLVAEAHEARQDLINTLLDEREKLVEIGGNTDKLAAIDLKLKALTAADATQQDPAVAAGIERELRNAVTRSEEGVENTRQEYKDLLDVNVAWSSPNGNINDMMDHLEAYDKRTREELEAIKKEIDDSFREINENRRAIIQNILPNCPNDQKSTIEGNLHDIEERIMSAHSDLHVDISVNNFDKTKAQEYLDKFRGFRDELKKLYQDNLDTAK